MFDPPYRAVRIGTQRTGSVRKTVRNATSRQPLPGSTNGPKSSGLGDIQGAPGVLRDAPVMTAWMIGAGLLGAVAGSFLNVCVLRWPRDESVVRPRSRCPACGRPLSWLEMVPVLGWLALWGRCRSCRSGIAVQYPLVEAAVALLWVGSLVAHGPMPEALRTAVFLTLLLGIAAADVRFYIIPDQLSLGGATIGLVLAPLAGGITMRAAVLGAGIGFGALWVVGRVSTTVLRRLAPARLERAGVNQALGGGDIKMMLMVGAFVGPWGVGVTVLIGSMLALLVFGPLAAVSRRLIPFGVFLAAGAGTAHVWGAEIVAWYLSRFS